MPPAFFIEPIASKFASGGVPEGFDPTPVQTKHFSMAVVILAFGLVTR
jgi:hypothetical protein